MIIIKIRDSTFILGMIVLLFVVAIWSERHEKVDNDNKDWNVSTNNNIYYDTNKMNRVPAEE